MNDSQNVKLGRVLLLVLLSMFLIFLECTTSKGSNQMEVSTSCDSLKSYVSLPGLEKARWILQPLGKHSAFSFGPQDFAFYLYSDKVSDIVRDYIKKNLQISEVDSQKILIEATPAQSLGIDTSLLNKNNEFFEISGAAYDAGPILVGLTSGVLVVTKNGIVLVASTT